MQLLFDGVGIGVAVFALCALLLFGPRALLKVPTLLVLVHGAALFVKSLVPMASAAHSPLRALALFALLASIARAFSSLMLELRVTHSKDDAVSKRLRALLATLVYFVVALLVIHDAGVAASALIFTAALILATLLFLLRDAVADLLAGLTAQASLKVGDVITIDEREGEVLTLGWRAVTLRTDDGEVTVPNATLASVVSTRSEND